MVRSVLVAALLMAMDLDGRGQAAPAAKPDRLHELNQSFVPAYQARAARLGATNPAYVEVSGDSLLLHLHGDPAVKAQVLPERYQHLKDVAHVPFTIYLSLVGLKAGPLAEGDLTRMRGLLNALNAAEEALPSAGFEGQEMARQRQILDGSRTMMERTLKSGAVDPEALKVFARTMGPLLKQNADEAGCLQVQTMHAQMMRWKALMSRDEWETFAVVNKSPHQPRYRDVDTQYFGWLLGGAAPAWAYPGETSRVIYAETVFGPQSAGDELLSVRVDFEAGKAFFGDEWRLSEDILSDGAARCVKSLDVGDREWKK